MDEPDGLADGMRTHPDSATASPAIDDVAAERLLADPGAAPGPGLEALAAVLAAAAAPAPPGPQPGEEAALAHFREAMRDHAIPPLSWRRRMLAQIASAKIAAAALASGLVLTGGVAAAATGTLPDTAQETAQDMFAQVGISVPGPDDGDEPRSEESGKPADAGDEGKGAEISDLATTTEGSPDKGEVISDAASSEGQTRSEERSSEVPAARDDTDHAPESLPTEAAGDDAPTDRAPDTADAGSRG